MDDLTVNERFSEWIDLLFAGRRFGADDRLGTANLINADARLRAAQAVTTGHCLSLSRSVAVRDDGAGVSVEITHRELDRIRDLPPFVGGPVDIGGDVTHVNAHGLENTHLDGFNHIGRSGLWYNGYRVDDLGAPSAADLANHGLYTRAVIADIPAVRGTDWVDPNSPVTGDDIDAALRDAQVEFHSGDALLLYMGRDRYERAGNSVITSADSYSPGAGWSAARWIVEHDVSILCWDFLDAWTIDEPVWSVHLLSWAIGLVLIDNADLGAAAAQARELGRTVGALVVTTPPIPGATGALVQPLFLQ